MYFSTPHFQHTDDIDHSEIITHIQRRMKNYDAWSQCGDDDTSIFLKYMVPIIKTTNSFSNDATPVTSGISTRDKEILSQFFDETDNNVILSLHNDYYRRIMWSHFKILGKDRDLDTEKLIGETIFDIFKKKLSSSTSSSGNKTARRGRRSGKFYKLDKTCTSIEVVNDDAALASKCVVPFVDLSPICFLTLHFNTFILMLTLIGTGRTCLKKSLPMFNDG